MYVVKVRLAALLVCTSVRQIAGSRLRPFMLFLIPLQTWQLCHHHCVLPHPVQQLPARRAITQFRHRKSKDVGLTKLNLFDTNCDGKGSSSSDDVTQVKNQPVWFGTAKQVTMLRSSWEVQI